MCIGASVKEIVARKTFILILEFQTKFSFYFSSFLRFSNVTRIASINLYYKTNAPLGDLH